MKDSPSRPVSGSETGELQDFVKKSRLGFFGVLGLFGFAFAAVHLLFYLYARLLSLPGVYTSSSGFLGLTSGAWLLSLILPAIVCYAFLRSQDTRNRERFTREWDSWHWFDFGVEMIGTQEEFSDKQEESFAKATILDPTDPYALNNLGAVLQQKGRTDEAIEAYHSAIKNDPGYYKPYTNLGAAYAQKGDAELAIGFYRKALEINPRDAATHLNLGIALARLGNKKEAALYFKQFLNLAPDHPRAMEIKNFVRSL